jgi:hypothetical protein
VEAGHAGLEAGVVVGGPLASLLHDELLEAVGIGADVSGPGVGLLEVGGELATLGLGVVRVDAGRGGEEEALDLVLHGGGEKVDVDAEGVLEDDGVVGLDETHTTHVCVHRRGRKAGRGGTRLIIQHPAHTCNIKITGGKIIDFVDAVAGLVAVALVTKVKKVELVAVVLHVEVNVFSPSFLKNN